MNLLWKMQADLNHATIMYPANYFVFVQDTEPSYWAKATLHFLRNVDAAFISAEELATHSPALNPLDYSVWDILQELVYERWRQPYANIQELQKAMRQKWNEIKDQTTKNAILQWKRHLVAVTKTGGGPIQHIFSWTLVKAADNWLNILWFFCIFDTYHCCA